MWLTPEFGVTRWGAQNFLYRRNDPAFHLGITF